MLGLSQCEMAMQDGSRAPRSQRLALRSIAPLLGFCLALGCVDLTPPAALVKYRNGAGGGGSGVAGDS
ncbi:MAG: hypothetical protein ABSB49_02570, partial [Polyangia bacterium]